MVPVHLYGQPCDMEALVSIAHRHKLWIVEDAAEAHGATYHGVPVGGIGDVGVFSFYGNKVITCGEGGMLTTNSAVLAERIALFRGQGVDPHRRYFHTVRGYNYRMTNLQAALGLAQLEGLSEQLRSRRETAASYAQQFARAECDLVLQAGYEDATSAHWMVVGLVDKNRDQVMQQLQATELVETRPTFVPLNQLPMYQSVLNFPVSDDIGERGICFPTYYGLMPDDIMRISCATAGIIHES
jgi:perosamine synthetase